MKEKTKKPFICICKVFFKEQVLRRAQKVIVYKRNYKHFIIIFINNSIITSMIRTYYSLYTRLKMNQIECGEDKNIKNNWTIQR